MKIRSILMVAGVIVSLSQLTLAQCPENCDGTNTALGESAFINNTTGGYNTALGRQTLTSNTTGYSNTAVGDDALTLNTTGYYNVAVGSSALEQNDTGNYNVAVGRAALQNHRSGDNNIGIGAGALLSNLSGSNNVAIGSDALLINTAGTDNVAIGYYALLNNGGTGSRNIAVGYQAGINVCASCDNNILIGNNGTAADNKTIRIGSKTTHKATYIAGISGATVAGGVGALIDSNGHLGTTTSSARFKENIQPMAKSSEALLSLQPVTFRYKKQLDPDGIRQFGLVAEQVEKVNPDLVVRDEQGKPYSVRYEAVNAMLLNEFLKEHRKVEKLEATVAQLQEQIQALTSDLQKVSAKVETSTLAPRVIVNNL